MMKEKTGKMSNKIIVVWTITIFLLLASIFIYGKYYLKNEGYILLKQEFKANVKKYLKEKDLYPEKNKSVVVSKDVLVEEEVIEELKYKDKECDAEAKVTKKLVFYTYDIKLDCK